MAEELAKFRARLAGPTSAELARKRAEENRRFRISRRATLRALLAGAAVVTGLARVELELRRRSAPAWWIADVDADRRIPRADTKTLEALYRACVTGGGQPDFIVCNADVLEAYKEAIRS